MVMRESVPGDGGFTLIELLVAIAVFAVLAGITYGTLSSALDAREQTDERSSRRAEIMQAVTILDRDLLQMIGRPIRDEYDQIAPALRIERPPAARIELTRAGLPNPRGEKRSSLQRVAYSLDGDRLVRRSWTVLDRTPQSYPREEILLSQVRTLLFEAMQSGWSTTWPPDTRASDPAADNATLPRAVRVTLDLEDLGELVRVLPLVEGFADLPANPGGTGGR